MYESKVIKAKREYLRHKNEEGKKEYQKHKSRPSLWPSDLFSCHRKSAYHVLGEPQSLPFSDDSLAYMRGGVVFEDDTGLALDWYYDKSIQSVVLKNDIWSGKADFVLNHLQPNVTIIEHKATGTNKMKDDKQLPKKEHLAQLGLYGKLYKELYNLNAELILYYIAWGCEAEYDIKVESGYIQVTGIQKYYDKETFVSKRMRIDLQKEIDELERMYRNVLEGKPLPPRLDKKYKGCEFKGIPSCQYYHSCWGNK